jgi:hypothetical protein
MNTIRTIRLQDAIGNTLQAAALEDRRVVLLWTDQSCTIIYAQAGYDGDGPELEDAYQSDVYEELSDVTLESLGIITQEERLQRHHAVLEKANASRLAYEHHEELAQRPIHVRPYH